MESPDVSVDDKVKNLNVHISVPVDGSGHQDVSDSHAGETANEQDDLSDQSEGESYSAPSGEALSRDPSEPLFDADFEVRKFSFILCNQKTFPSLHHFSCFQQTAPPAAQEPPLSDTADLLGLNADPQSARSISAPKGGVQGGMKAASSNSDLLSDLFAPSSGQTGAVQEDLFFTEAPDSKRKPLFFFFFFLKLVSQ